MRLKASDDTHREVLEWLETLPKNNRGIKDLQDKIIDAIRSHISEMPEGPQPTAKNISRYKNKELDPSHEKPDKKKDKHEDGEDKEIEKAKPQEATGEKDTGQEPEAMPIFDLSSDSKKKFIEHAKEITF